MNLPTYRKKDTFHAIAKSNFILKYWIFKWRILFFISQILSQFSYCIPIFTSIILLTIIRLFLKNTIFNAQCTIFLTFIGLLLFLLSLPSSSLSEVIGGTVTGNGFKNYLFGTMADDTIIGKEGNDRLYGLAGADKIFGDSGDDILQGDQGNDILNGDDGNDLIVGGGDADNIVGGNGDDILIASYAVNNTSIRDYAQDLITCGSGDDIAYFNIADNDSASNDCENLISASGPASNSTVILPEVLESLQEKESDYKRIVEWMLQEYARTG